MKLSDILSLIETGEKGIMRFELQNAAITEGSFVQVQRKYTRTVSLMTLSFSEVESLL